MDRPGDPTQWNIFKIVTACCQITCAIPWLPCKQLPYPPEHPRISRMRQRNKSDLPLPTLSYKYFLLGYSFSILSFYSPKSTFTAAAPPEDSKNFNEGPLHQSPKSSIFFLARTWPSTSPCLRSLHYFSFSHLYCISVHPQFLLLNISLFLFFLLSSKISRIWPIKLLFLPINPTSNVLVR